MTQSIGSGSSDDGGNCLPEAIHSTAQVRQFDRDAIDDAGIPGYELMTRAGAGALAALRRHYPGARRVTVVCGGGNNGGDGYVLARLAHAAGLVVEVIALADPAGLSGDAARACADAVAGGVAVESADSVAAAVARADVIVDGIFGTGLSREVGGGFAAAIGAINSSGKPVVALDVPSGIDSDTGSVHGCAVSAAVTVTFVGLKQGQFLGQAPDHCGRLEFTDLGIPPSIAAAAPPVLRRVTLDWWRQQLPPRPRMSHKGLNGSVLLIGGAPGMSGAIRLAGEASLRAGAGLVRIATHPMSVAAVMAGRPELMCRGVDAAADLGDWLEAADAVVLGPGLGQTDWAEALFAAVIDTARPLVVDADGLNLLAAQRRRRSGWLLTPHPGEAGRLLGTSAAAVQADRLGALRAIAERYGADVVLKGACSLIAEADESNEVNCYVCDRGNPGMATGGMGDLLAGVAGAIAAGRRGLAGAGRLATLVHALAGDDAAAGGERGMIASDLLMHIRARLNPA